MYPAGQHAISLPQYRVFSLDTLLVSRLAILSADAYPREACAGLFGKCSDHQAALELVVPLRNYSRSNHRFAVSLSDLQAAHPQGKPGTVYLGLFHSHTGGVSLSRADQHSLQRHPFIWLIGSLAPRASQPSRMKLKAYLWSSGHQYSLRIDTHGS